MSFQEEKNLIRRFFADIEAATADTIAKTLRDYCTQDNYCWHGVYPFLKQHDIDYVAQYFWQPLLRTFTHLQRRQDIFFAGHNKADEKVWVMSMGHFIGLFDQAFLGIPPTKKLTPLRYAEFHCVQNNVIQQSAIFIDLIGLMQYAKCSPLPDSLGQYFCYPGPKTHDGLLYNDAPHQQSVDTLSLLNKMIDDLDALNKSGAMNCPIEVLAKTWSKNMLWYGPAGIGSTYTIERYQQQHQLPFRANLTDKKFHGHVCRIAEGHYAGFFGWPNLSNSPIGGWLGLPGGAKDVAMHVVDVYGRDKDKLIENWVFIDIPYWLSQQGFDVLERNALIHNQSYRPLGT